MEMVKVFYEAKNGENHVYYECPVCGERYRVYYKRCLRCHTDLGKPIGMRIVKEVEK